MGVFDAPLIESEADLERYAAISSRLYWTAGVLILVVGSLLAYFGAKTWMQDKALWIFLLGVFLGGFTGVGATQRKMAQLYRQLIPKGI